MTEATLAVYAPCKTHRLWFDQSGECFYCLVERDQDRYDQGAATSLGFAPA